jgi:hypothetical protein
MTFMRLPCFDGPGNYQSYHLVLSFFAQNSREIRSQLFMRPVQARSMRLDACLPAVAEECSEERLPALQNQWLPPCQNDLFHLV